MTPKYLTLLLILPAVYSKIHIEMSPSTGVHPVGDDVAIISDIERQSFHLSDYKLKTAVKIFFGSRPDDVFLRSPTPWNDLYTTYDWSQVRRILTPVRSRILTASSESPCLIRHYLDNNSSNPTTITVGLKEKIINRISTAWQKEDNLTVVQDIEYSADFGLHSKLDNLLLFTSKWGEDNIIEEQFTLMPTNIRLGPGQRVIVEFYVTKDTMKVQVDYKATLSGSIAINYANKFKGHHFWALDINEVMRASGFRTTMSSSELIELEYHSNLRMDVKNAEDNSLLYNTSASFCGKS